MNCALLSAVGVSLIQLTATVLNAVGNAACGLETPQPSPDRGPRTNMKSKTLREGGDSVEATDSRTAATHESQSIHVFPLSNALRRAAEKDRPELDAMLMIDAANVIERLCLSHDELLAALREVAHHADDECGFMVTVRAAIAKAEGR